MGKRGFAITSEILLLSLFFLVTSILLVSMFAKFYSAQPEFEYTPVDASLCGGTLTLLSHEDITVELLLMPQEDRSTVMLTGGRPVTLHFFKIPDYVVIYGNGVELEVVENECK